MRKTLIFAAIAALTLTSAAEARICHDAHGKWVKCPSAAAAEKGAATMAKANNKAANDSAHAAKVDLSTARKAAGNANADANRAARAVTCKTGKPCGASCIPMGRVCHK